jgi:hypothetical protein
MTTLKVTDLDFDTIKSNLKNFMRSNPTFTDYDFEASGLSFLLDVMAYNTHYNAIQANFMANEMFLDTAVKRNSVISHAKALGYKPKGYISARAKVNLTIDAIYVSPGASVPNEFIMRRGTQFTTQIDGAYYSFVTDRDYSAPLSGGKYYFTDVELVEGLYNTYAWMVTADNSNYTIPNPRVDVASIKMQTYPNSLSFQATDWYHYTSLFNIDDKSKAFFTQETFNELIDIYFGNGSIGARPAINSVIRIEYITTNGLSGNGAKTFTSSGSIKHNAQDTVYVQDYTLTLVYASSGGANAETIDEIKYHASKHFSVQNRAVTTYDYESIIRENFNNAEAIKVWGGEDNVPPQYNSVMLCIKPHYSDYLTDIEKDQIRGILKNKAIMNIRPIFVEPDYLNIKVNTTVRYALNKLPSASDIRALVRNAILAYSDTTLEQFNSSMVYSQFVKAIDDSYPAIIGNLTDIKMVKTVAPNLGVPRSFVVNFGNPIFDVNNAIVSTQFYSSASDLAVIITNIGTRLVLSYSVEGSTLKTVRDIGTVDFAKGVMTVDAIIVTALETGAIEFVATPAVSDIYSIQNNILRILPTDITITPIAE